MTIKQKIVGKSLATSLLVAAVGLLSATSMLRIGTTLRSVESTSLPEARSADQLEGAAAKIDGLMDAYRDAVQAQRQTEGEHLKTEVDAAFDQIELATSQLDQTLRLSSTTGHDRPLLASIEEQARVARANWSQLHSAIGGSNDTKLQIELLDGLSVATGSLMRSSLDLERGTKDDMMQGILAARSRVTASVRLLIISALLAIILAVSLALVVSMPLSARLARLRDGAKEVGTGNFQARLKVEASDEIGQLATAFNEMAAGLQWSQDEIRESESKFRELAETIHEVFWVSDPTSMKLQYVSPAYEQVWGRSCESVYKDLRSFAEAIIPEDRPRVLAKMEKAVSEGIDQEYRIVRPDGTMRYIHDRGFPVRDESGRVTRIVGIAEDITERRLADQEKHRLAEHVQLLLDSTGEGICGIDTAGLCTFVNRIAAKLLGYSAGEMVGKHVHSLLHHKHPDGLAYPVEECPIYLALLSGTSCRADDEVFWRRDGSAMPVEYSSFPIFEGEKVMGAVVAFSEITSRKQAKEALRLSEERLRLALDAAKLGTFDFSILTGELNWDEANKRIWGLPSDQEVDYAEALKRLHPEDGPRIQQVVQASMDPQGSGYYEAEYRIIWPDGSVHWTIGRGQVHFEAEGERRRACRMVGVQIDITDRRNAEDALQHAHEQLEHRVEARTAELQYANEALRQSESELQRAKDTAEAANQAKGIIFDTALDAIVTIDSHSVITEWNLQAETMFRWDRTEAVGLRLDQTIIPQSQWEAHHSEIEGFTKTGDSPLLNKVGELVARRRDGREFPVELAITPAWSGDECTFTAFIRDITTRKQAEVDLRQARDAAENASRAKSEFLANMSHEIRTPLNGVIGMSDLLLDTGLDQKQRRFAELIKSSGASLADLINDILDFSKIEARKLEIESIDFNLYGVVEEVMETMQMKATPKGLDLGCLTLPDVPRQVKGDPQRVKQILINLVNNAIKFTESGSVSTRLTVDSQSQGCAIVRFSVTDTGVGIPADRMDRLFKSFSQVDASTTRSHGGTGLGLAISKQLAELMGGSVGVESTLGHGSTFWFTVKLSLVPQMTESAVAIDSRGLRILAVHADPAIREILRDQLSSWKLEAAVASTGNDAMRMLHDAANKDHPFDVAIIDSEMPDILALELGKAIKSSPEIAETVLLILLPWGADFDPLELSNSGFASHILKPVRQSHLYNSIVDAMGAYPQTNRTTNTPAVVPTADSAVRNIESAAPAARILIAEDNRVNQIVAIEVLTKHGYACDVVDNGNKAVAAVLKGGYDLVLMDCSMPEMDGFEATRLIRSAENADPAKHLRRTPIIALTANAIKGDRDQCLDAGMDDYVSKPLDPSRLIKAIQTQLVASKTASAMGRPEATVSTTGSVVRRETMPMSIDALLDRCMGNAAAAVSILDEFEREAIDDLAHIKQRIETGDCVGLAKVAHSLKGASSILSADALTDLAIQLEQVGQSGILAEQDHLLSQLNNEIQRCIGYLPAARTAIAKETKV